MEIWGSWGARPLSAPPLSAPGWCSCYTCLPRTAPVAAQTGQKTAAPGIGTGAPQMDQRLLTNTWPKQGMTVSIQASTNKS